MSIKLIAEQIVNRSQTLSYPEAVLYAEVLIRGLIETIRENDKRAVIELIKTDDNGSLQRQCACDSGCDSKRKELTELTGIEYHSLKESGELQKFYPEATGDYSKDIMPNEEII
jgi:hypothetical protein